MDRDELQKEVGNLLRLVALLFGVIGAAGAAMIVLLLISIFVEVGLSTAFALQLLAGAAGAGVSLWRTS